MASNPGFSYTKPQLQEIAADILKAARKRGASACELDISEGFGQSVSVRMGTVDTIEYNRDKGVEITVYLGQRRGHASTSDFSRAALKSAVDAAVSIARFTAPDPCAGLADKASMAHDCPDLDLLHPWDIGVDDAIALARQCEGAAFAVDPSIRNSEGANVSTHYAHFVSANSLGFMDGFASSQHALSCAVIAGEGETMQREYWHDSRRDATELTSVEDVGRIAGERALARLGAKKIRTRQAPVIFEAPLAVSLLGSFVQAASGSALYRRSSFLFDTLGQQVFSPVICISERPHLKKAFGATWFDSDGVATHDREVVINGVLQGYFLSTYSARKLGLQTTGNAGGSHNLRVKAGEDSLDALLHKMDKGLLVTELLGHGINYVTGDYSRGAVGFWVEKGKIKHPVQEITIAGNLRDMFRNIIAIGNDALARGAKHCGSVLVENMKIAGQ
ncbi:MAG: metalloprotease PmbA [Betaproteobacteria bacterium]|nr:metalloprotease PmbA [Betaproteobacteria bacterium]